VPGVSAGSSPSPDRYTDRVAALRARARGRTLELERTPLLPPGPFDTVVSIGYFGRSRDLAGSMTAVLDRLADDGQLLFAEPSPSPRGRLRPDHDQTDIAGRLRRSGFLITAIERMPMISSRRSDNWAMVGTARRARWLPPDGLGTR
jgi:hypothetical protein